MSTENYQVDKYQYEFHQEMVNGSTRELTLLSLFDDSKNLLCGIAFVADDSDLMAPSESENGHVAIQLHAKSFAPILDMLRNEKPVYFSWWREAQSMRLSTAKEPVGEQELRKLFNILYV